MMSDVENPGVSEEVAAPETSGVIQEVSQSQKPESDKDYNWRRANEEMRELQRQNRLLQENLLKLQKPAVDELDQVPDDELLTKAQVAKIAERYAQQAAQKALKEKESERWKSRAKEQYSDFDQVVTPETIKLLETQMPGYAQSLDKLTDPYDIAVAAYEAIKNSGIDKKLPGLKQQLENQEKIQKNLSKPASSNGVGKSPLADAHNFDKRYSKDQLAQAYKEMVDSARRA